MRQWPALQIWAADAWRAGVAVSRQLSVRLVIVAVVGTLVVLGALSAAFRGGWLSLGTDLAVNIAASAIVAGTAVAGFLLSTRRRALRQMLAVRRAEQGRATADEESVEQYLRGQAAAIAAQIRDPKQSGALLIEAATGSARSLFLKTLVATMAKQGMVGMLVDTHDLQSENVAEAVNMAVRRILRSAGVEDAPLVRTVEALAARRQLVALVNGLDESDQPVSTRSAVEIVRDRLDALTITGLPVVALVEQGSTPPELVDIALRLPTIDAETVLALVGLPPHLAADSVVARARLGAARRFAGSLQQRGIDVRTIGDAVHTGTNHGATAVMTLDRLGSDLSNHGPMAFVTQHLWDIGFMEHRSFFRRSWRSAAAFTLDRLGRHLLTHDLKQATLAGLLADDHTGSAQVVTGLADLEGAGLIERGHHGGRVLIRFREPLVREFVVGVSAGRLGLSFGYTMRRGTVAFVGEAVGRAPNGGRRNETWQQILAHTAKHGLLSAASEVAQLVSLHAGATLSLSESWLTEAWENADDRERSRFVRRLPQRIEDHHVWYLWSRLIPPQMALTAHPLRRTIARHLGAAGDQAWEKLGADWTLLVDNGERGGLAWHRRRGDPWKKYGGALASLCWLLPSVALTSEVPSAAILYERLVDLCVPGGGPDRSEQPDVGIEISIAEGAKDMAYLALVREDSLPADLLQPLRKIVMESRSWVSQLLGLQALVLATAGDPGLVGLLRSCCGSMCLKDRVHPITQRYATAVSRVLDDPGHELNAVVHKLVWADDTEALAGAGGNLMPAALEVLASATLVLNLVESRIRSGSDPITTHSARVAGLTSPQLPGCLRSPLLARAYGRAPCACGLGLCDTSDRRSLRAMSSSFAYRCLCDSDVTRAAGPWLGRALSLHLQRIARHDRG